VGIILGWQNTSGIEDRLGYLAVFKDPGGRLEKPLALRVVG